MDLPQRQWVEQTTGRRVVGSRRNYSGGSRELWFLDLAGKGGDIQKVVLRAETGSGSFSGTELSLEREAALYRALEPTQVPIPHCIAVTADGTAMLLERVPGESDLLNLPEQDQLPVFDDFMRALGALHRLDVSKLGLDVLPRPVSPRDHAELDLRLWQDLAEAKVTYRDPLLTYALSWLASFAPQSVQRTVLVHGDLGPGNFLASDGRVTGLVDWEMAHFGDPMDDLAWLKLRSETMPVAGFSDEAARHSAYELYSGLRIDAVSLAYYDVFVAVRLAVISGLAISRGGGALGIAPYLHFHHGSLARLGRHLATATGTRIEPEDLDAAGDSAPDPVYGHVLDLLTSKGLDHLEDRKARRAVREAVSLVRYLQERDRVQEQLIDLDRADRAELKIGAAAGSDALYTLAGAAGGSGEPAVLHYLVRRVTRTDAVWRASVASSDPGR